MEFLIEQHEGRGNKNCVPPFTGPHSSSTKKPCVLYYNIEFPILERQNLCSNSYMLGVYDSDGCNTISHIQIKVPL